MYTDPRGLHDQAYAERALLALGGVLLAVAPFLSWVSVVVLGGFDLPTLLSATDMSGLIAYAATVAGVAVILVAVLARSIRTARRTALGVGCIAAVLGGLLGVELIRAVSASRGIVQLGVGAILAMVGCALLVVPPIVGYVREPAYPYPPRRSVPSWLAGAAAIPLAAVIAWLPLHSSAGTYCGTPVGAMFKSHDPIPSDAPPAEVATQLQADQAALASAQSAANAQQGADAQAQQEQASADQLSSRAQQADTAAQEAASTVESDQATVDGDQGDLDAAQAAVSADQQAVQNDQQQLTSDQQNGYDTSYDQQALSQDQQTLATDQQAAQVEQAKVAHDQAMLSGDQNAAAAAQHKADQLDQQAQAAQAAASNDAQQSTSDDSSVQQNLDTAQQQLQNDQSQWQQTHADAVAAATSYNTALSACQRDAVGQLVLAVAVAVIGIAVSVGVLAARRRARARAARPGW